LVHFLQHPYQVFSYRFYVSFLWVDMQDVI
jgi:hypothetical protein